MGRQIAAMLFLLTGVMPGQEALNAPVPKVTLATFAVLGSEILADGVTTRVLYQRSYAETDPLAKPFVHAGVPGQVGASLLGAGTIGGVWFVLHRAHREGMARWFLRSVTAAEGCNVGRQFSILRTSRK
ncbi:MAG: hypothetical protein WAK89_16470 [Candidatus Sulfotelmatobacter sp.]